MKNRSLYTATILLSLLLFSSCASTFFYTKVDTETPLLEKVENGDFLYENDSLWIAYSFRGEDAPIEITVGNKLDEPLYVDWDRSVLILDGTAYSYNTGKIESSLISSSVSYRDWIWGNEIARGVIEGTSTIPKHISFIPPKTMINHSSLRLAARFDEIGKENYSNGKLVNSRGDVSKIKRINYDVEDSPLRFSSYLTIYNSKNEPIIYTSDFYISTLLKTQIKPEDLPDDMAERGDVFYQYKKANNTGWHILGSIAIVTTSVALDVMLYGDEY